MPPLSRNDLCYCGSGQKYKRCHLSVDNAGVLLPNGDRSRDLGVIAQAIPSTDERARRRVERCRESLLQRIGQGLAGEAAAAALTDYLAALEAELADVLARRSRLLWLQLLRRRPPRPIGSSSTWTVQLYRRIADLAVLKHGGEPMPDEQLKFGSADGPTLVAPALLDTRDAIDVAAVEILAEEYNAAASAYRRVCKGAVLSRHRGDFAPLADQALQLRMKTYDRRVADFNAFAASAGASVSTEPNLEEDGAVLAAVVPNVEGRPATLLGSAQGSLGDEPSNFVPSFLGLDEVRPVLVQFDDLICAEYGVSTDALLACVWGLGVHTLNCLATDPGLPEQLFTTGYLVFSQGERIDGVRRNVAEYVRHWWLAQREQELDHEEATKIVEEVFAALTWSDDSRASIDLWSRTPHKLLSNIGGAHLFDFAALGAVVAGAFTTFAAVDGEAGNIKARSFEVELVRRMTEAGHTPWETRKKLKHSDGEREIDASFVAGSTLFVVEAKAFAQNARIERGEYVALSARWQTLTKYLHQAKTLKQWLDSRPVGRNYELPAAVTRIEYLVCTPAAEWIADDDPTFFLTDQIPRICTPEELNLLLERAGGF